MKKGFTLVELTIAMTIIAVICVIMVQAINPKKFNEKTNKASGIKAINFVEQACAQILDLETTQAPASRFMVKPAGGSWEFAIYNTDGTTSADSLALATLFGNHLKYESGILNFCDNTSYCSDTSIQGARVAGGVYIGFEKLNSIVSCPAYRMPGETTDNPAPQEFDNGSYTAKQCWGKLYVDVNGKDAPNQYGQDVFIYGLGEYGLEK